MRVMLLGLRGFPNVQGGVEKHVEELAPLLVKLGCKVDILARSAYQPEVDAQSYPGIRFIKLWAPQKKSLEAIIHTFLGVCYAAVSRPDILHIHAIGPSLMVPLARLFGLRVVVTHHGPDYDRQKWGGFAKRMLELGERWGMRYASARIVISDVIRKLVNTKYGLDSHLIPNGVQLPTLLTSGLVLEQFGLISGRYILLVSRLVPEKRHQDLVKAFALAALQDWKLVLVGASDHPDDYVRELQESAASASNVIMTGYQRGDDLRELYSNAGFFVLPSSHEGLPIAMLEALSYGLPVLASDIPANMEVGLDTGHYFPLGNIEALSSKLQAFSRQPLGDADRNQLRLWVQGKYDWQRIAVTTFHVYGNVVYRGTHNQRH